MFDTKLFLFTTFLSGICHGQYFHSSLPGTMYDIPSKIHHEIFGYDTRRTLPFIDLTNFDSKMYLATPLLSQKRSLGGLNYNNIAYGFGQYQTLSSNATKSLDKIPLATELFAPAVIKFPAATKGQVEAYKKALEEEAKEAEKEMQKAMEVKMMAGNVQDQPGVDVKAVSYVNVRLGGTQNVNYHYSSI